VGRSAFRRRGCSGRGVTPRSVRRTDTAFDALDPEILAAYEAGGLDNLVRYVWLGHHTVHRPYPSREFTEGLQGSKRT
jgi:hypothetical protein